MLSESQIAAIHSTWEQIVPNAEAAAALFYENLFKSFPRLRSMFDQVAMTEQRTKLVMALSLVVRSLGQLSSVLPLLRELGRRHAEYGVTEPHYGMVGEALIDTLQQGLGDGFTPEAREAWGVAYGMVAAVMLDGAKRSAAA